MEEDEKKKKIRKNGKMESEKKEENSKVIFLFLPLFGIPLLQNKHI